jgi:hypothetical protein
LVAGDLHEVGHNGDPKLPGIPSVGLLQRHVSHRAYLIDKPRNTPEAVVNVLGNSIIAFTAMQVADHQGNALGDLSL